MNKITKISLIGLLSLCVMVGTGGVANATLTLGSTTIASGGGEALTLTANLASTWSCSAGDLTISADTNSLLLTSAEATADAVYVHASVGGMTLQTAGTTTHGLDITLAATSVDGIDVTSANTTADVFDIDAAALTTGNILNLAAPTTRTDGAALLITDAGVAATVSGDLVQINVTGTPDTNILDVDVSGISTTSNVLDVTYTAASLGNAIDVNMGSSVAGSALDIQGAGIRTEPLIFIDGDNTDAATNDHVIDIDQTGVLNSNVLDITYDTGASDGKAIDLNMGTNVAGDAINIGSAATTGNGIIMAFTALTTGEALTIAQTGEALAAGELLMITNTEVGDLVAKTGNLVSVTSDLEENVGVVTSNYDMALFSRADTQSHASQYDAQGSVVKILKTLDKAAGTIVDAVVGLEIESAVANTALPLGDTVKITEVGVGAKALNIISASTSVSDVLITGSGVKAINKGVLEVTSSGATAAGGAVLRVGATGIPAASTSYLANFDYSGATVATNDPIAVYINGGDSDDSTLHVTGGEAIQAGSGNIEILNTDDAAVGAVLLLEHTPGAGNEADNDVVARVSFYGQDDGDVATEYARIDAITRDVTDAGSEEDGSIEFHVRRASASKQILELGWDDTADAAVNGIMVGDGAGAGIVSTFGTQDLTISTNGGTNSGTITITDAANGDIALAPNGTGRALINNSAFPTTAVTAIHTMAVAESGWVTCTSAAPYTITLPAVATADGVWYAFKKTDAAANAITIDGDGAETIDGAANTAEIDAQYDTIAIYCDGTAWHIFQRWIH